LTITIAATVGIAWVTFAQTPSGLPGSSRSDVRCGSYCLYVALKALDLGPGTYEELEEALGPPSDDGYSMLQLQEQAERFGAETLAVKTTLENLRKRERPLGCIAYLDERSHYVLIGDIEDNTVFVVDPPRSYELPAATLSALWSGEALLLSHKPLAPEEALSGRGVAFPLIVIAVISVIAIAALLAVGRWNKHRAAS